MAATAVLPAMNGEKRLHPLFAKTNDVQADLSDTTVLENHQSTKASDAADNGQSGKANTQRKPGLTLQANRMTQKTLQDILNPKVVTSEPPSHDNGTNVIKDDSDHTNIDSSCRKRKRTSHIESVEVGDPSKLFRGTAEGTLSLDSDSHDVLETTTSQRQRSPQVLIPISRPVSTENEATEASLETAPSIKKSPPKKMLKLNATGKFSSPTSRKSKEDVLPAESEKKRGRSRKSKEFAQGKHLIAKVRYGTGNEEYQAELGQRIDRILSGEERHSQPVQNTPKKRKAPRKAAVLAKPTHPFFLGKPDEQVLPKNPSPRKTSAVTPGKLKRQAIGQRPPSPLHEANDFYVSALLKDRLIVKHPGAKEPAWPAQEQAHIRGLDEEEIRMISRSSSGAAAFGKRKQKNTKWALPVEESLLTRFTNCLVPEEEGELRADGFQEPHPSLILPQRALISGYAISQKVAKELSVTLGHETETGLAVRPCQHSIHPALQKLYSRIPNTLSAFDEGVGEVLSWTQKYAPSTADSVLQPQSEMSVLREWLASLTVRAVVSAPKADPKPHLKPEPKPRKKRRKDCDMDDFLVDSDEEVHEMDELIGPKDIQDAADRKKAKSIVQVANSDAKLSNAVLLSGPCGCGKTTAAYAVAKELGFKVFEIGSHERRSGRDVLDKIGDMTENHLVRHHGTDASDALAAEEPSRIDQAFERDLVSGRQGKMNAFFKPATKAKHVSPKKKPSKEKTVEAIQDVLKKAPKEQQQSLILLEEVDTLFKDDKEFWTTVLKLIATSKRPFIMTCNDEDLVPLQAMSLHAILRLGPPPLDLATDCMLLIAAAEGHLLERDAVSSLYQSRGSDLRASIAALDWWCQMGIGDPKSGLSWIYQRWPPDADIDEHGRKIRVVSEGTFQHGTAFSAVKGIDEEAQLRLAYHEFGTEPAHVLGWEDMASMQSEQLPSLESFVVFADSLSAADVYSGGLQTATLDMTQPSMTDKARSQYVEGMALLQVDECIDYADMTLRLATVSTVATYRTAGLFPSTNIGTQLEAQLVPDKQYCHEKTTISRRDFTCFDALCVHSETGLSTGSGLVQSVWDGPLQSIVTDLAPYVRSIVEYDAMLAEQRERLNAITSDGRNSKRARTTRAARSALEGGQRVNTRRERWFMSDLNSNAVLATGGEKWPRSFDSLSVGSRDGTEAPSSSAESMAMDGGAQ